MKILSALLIGLLFGAGLIISGMINPAKVLGFLDIFGQWDASLAFVMGGAVITTFMGYRWILKKPNPLFSSEFSIPTKSQIDKPLLLGAILFGIGWGLVGLCPGPAIAAFSLATMDVWVFIVCMVGGMWAAKKLKQ